MKNPNIKVGNGMESRESEKSNKPPCPSKLTHELFPITERMLRTTLEAIETTYSHRRVLSLSDLPVEVQVWWSSYKLQVRHQQETALRLSGLSKLSVEERAALGLKMHENVGR